MSAVEFWKGKGAIVIESPYAADNEYDFLLYQNYLDKFIRKAVEVGRTPYASHMMLTRALDDTKPEERRAAIQMGLAMTDMLMEYPEAEWWFCLDHGCSSGMLDALRKAAAEGSLVFLCLDGRRVKSPALHAVLAATVGPSRVQSYLENVSIFNKSDMGLLMSAIAIIRKAVVGSV